MKRQCDEKRNVYEYMMAQQREKGRLRSGKGESFSQQQLQIARDEYDDEATLCVFRLKSLKQGQYRSLLTQAARHHAAQLNFFRKGLKSLEAVEPHIRLIAEKQHIDYQLSGLDDGEEEEDEGANSYETNDYGELSFDYRQNKQGLDAVSASRNSMELDQVDLPLTQASTMENAEVNLDKNQGEQIFNREPRPGSHSAPIYADRKFDPAERIREMQSSPARKYHSYVLPTPDDAKSSIPSRTSSSVSHSKPTTISGRTQNLWHSSPLEPEKRVKDFADDIPSIPAISKAQSILKESNNNNPSIQLPPPLAEGLSFPLGDTHNVCDTRKIKRQAFSGPLTSKPLLNKPILSASGPITSTELPQLVCGWVSQLPIPHTSSSPKVSPTASPPLVSSPRISELHELPRPPVSLASKQASSSGLTGHSAPLIFRNQEVSPTNKSSSVAINMASPLPPPPLTVPRSFSIPSSNQRATARQVAKLLETPQIPDKAEEVASPPLTPISLSNKPLPTVSEVTSHSGPIRGFISHHLCAAYRNEFCFQFFFTEELPTKRGFFIGNSTSHGICIESIGKDVLYVHCCWVVWSEAAEEVGRSLSTFVQSLPRLSGVSTCDLDEMHMQGTNRTIGDSLCSSLGDFQRKTSLELSKFQDDSFKHEGAMDVTSNVHGLIIGSVDKVALLTSKTRRNIQSPVSRIVGFESGRKDSVFDGFGGLSGDHIHSSPAVGVTVNETESSGSLIRKRMLSPLSGMLFPDQFSGDLLDIGCSNFQINSPATNDSHCVSMVQDYKKANIGSKNNFATLTCELPPHPCLSSPEPDPLRESSKEDAGTSAER
ncbi:hypothetical protein F0562_004781 [Nyssa sinensis]|uniref:BAR domain-containing protein n=1 Tax=Nyssa sinensis TaxID=561372 RepID=A0A5J5AJV7_9ASTE|nr:hypothetical protein F0562_004781 [Nyssa sinensis]